MDERPAPEGGPRAVLIKAGDGKWKIELKQFDAFRDRLGADVLHAFGRCFVHVDRLQSLMSLLALSEERYGRDSVTFERNMHTAVLFAVGTLRELASAIRAARSALAKRGLLDANTDPWVKLRAVEHRWENDEFFRERRNTIAFHVDEDVIKKGVDEIIKDPNLEVLLSRGDDRHVEATSISLGYLALINGMGMNLEQYEKFVTKVGEDQGIGEQVQLAFLEALDKTGIPYG
jgi:hypothetical protein